MSTALTTNGLWCHTTASSALTTNGLFCYNQLEQIVYGLIKLTAEVAQASVLTAMMIGDAAVELTRAVACASYAGAFGDADMAIGRAAMETGEGEHAAASSHARTMAEIAIGAAESAKARASDRSDIDAGLHEAETAIGKTTAFVEDLC